MSTKIIKQGNFDILSSHLCDTGVSVARRAAPNLMTPFSNTITVSAAITVTQMKNGRISTQSSGPFVALTLPSAANIIAGLNLKRGNYFELIVDNTNGGGSAGILLGAGVTQATVVPDAGSEPLNIFNTDIALYRFIVAEDEEGIIFSRLF